MRRKEKPLVRGERERDKESNIKSGEALKELKQAEKKKS